MAKGKPKKPPAPQVRFQQSVANRLCDRIAEGKLSIRAICDLKGMPNQKTVFRWLAVKDEFRQQYARAMEQRTMLMAEDLLDIADDGRNDFMEALDEQGDVRGWRENGEAIQRSRLRVDTRKWLMSKMLPKKYGDKVALEHSGPGGGPIEQVTAQMTPEEATRVYLERVRGAGVPKT